jgi:ATP-dependent protease Clp ATPase subunit
MAKTTKTNEIFSLTKARDLEQTQGMKAAIRHATPFTTTNTYVSDNEMNEQKRRNGMNNEAVETDDFEEDFSEALFDQIESFLQRVPFPAFYKAISKRVIGQDNLIHVLSNVYHYITSLLEDTPSTDHMLLAAPSGSGKTETYRALRDYFKQEIPNLPVLMFDMTQLSPTGFRGANKGEMLGTLFNLSKLARTMHPAAIFFLDEIDKKMKPNYDGFGKNVNADVQEDLLTMLEGSGVTVQRGTIFTDKVLFIGLGSFDAFRKEREEKTAKVGFNVQELSEEEKHFTYVTRENMISFGASHELLGRFPLIVKYDRLSEESVKAIIAKEVHALSSSYMRKISLSCAFRQMLLTQANSSFGCRMISSYLKESVLCAYEKELLSGERDPENTVYHLLSEHEAEVIAETEEIRKESGESY